MSIDFDLSINVEKFQSRTIGVVIRVDCEAALPPFRFELLTSRPGVQLEKLRVTDFDGNAVDHSIEGGEIKFAAGQIELTYAVKVDYSDCVGVDRDTEFNFPFIAEGEIYFSTGLIPFPVNLHDLSRNTELSFQVDGVPDSWQVFSSLNAGKLTASKMDNFFWYAAPDLNPAQIKFEGSETSMRFQAAVQHGKEIPITSGELESFVTQYMDWIEKNIAPYRQLSDVNCLILQAPPNYLELTGNSTFATGENVINGILAYGPDDPAGYRMLGSPSYRDYLFEGIAHEIMHFYTTTAAQGKYKSVLYPAIDCPPAHTRTIGESLNLYFVYQFVGEYLGDPVRLTNQLKSHLAHAQTVKRRNGLLDMYFLDQFLMGKGSSLLKLFSAMVRSKQASPGPYVSGEFMFEVLRNNLGVDIADNIQELILGTSIPDYQSIIHIE